MCVCIHYHRSQHIFSIYSTLISVSYALYISALMCVCHIIAAEFTEYLLPCLPHRSVCLSIVQLFISPSLFRCSEIASSQLGHSYIHPVAHSTYYFRMADTVSTDAPSTGDNLRGRFPGILLGDLAPSGLLFLLLLLQFSTVKRLLTCATKHTDVPGIQRPGGGGIYSTAGGFTTGENTLPLLVGFQHSTSNIRGGLLTPGPAASTHLPRCLKLQPVYTPLAAHFHVLLCFNQS